MPFAVLLTDDAAHDLEELYDDIARHDAPEEVKGTSFTFEVSPFWITKILTPRLCVITM